MENIGLRKVYRPLEIGENLLAKERVSQSFEINNFDVTKFKENV